jgi:hypothetical protein
MSTRRIIPTLPSELFLEAYYAFVEICDNEAYYISDNVWHKYDDKLKRTRVSFAGCLAAKWFNVDKASTIYHIYDYPNEAHNAIRALHELERSNHVWSLYFQQKSCGAEHKTPSFIKDLPMISPHYPQNRIRFQNQIAEVARIYKEKGM